MSILKTEIDTDPEGRGYSSMTNLEIANDLNTVYRQVNVETVSGQDLFESVVPSEFTPLTDREKSLFYAIIGMGSIRVNGTNTRTALLALFGPGTDTRANLAVLQKRDVSRAQELGIPYVYEGHVIDAKLET